MSAAYNKKRLYPKLVLILLVLILFVGMVLFALEKLGVTNLYSVNTKVTSNSDDAKTRPVNDVDYNPAQPNDNDTINDRKEAGDFDNSTNSASGNSQRKTTSNVTLSAAGQDIEHGPLIISAILGNIVSGNCDVLITKEGSKDITVSSTIIRRGNYYSCDGFEIPITDFDSDGQWNIKIEVTDNVNYGVASQQVNIVR